MCRPLWHRHHHHHPRCCHVADARGWETRCRVATGGGPHPMLCPAERRGSQAPVVTEVSASLSPLHLPRRAMQPPPGCAAAWPPAGCAHRRPTPGPWHYVRHLGRPARSAAAPTSPAVCLPNQLRIARCRNKASGFAAQSARLGKTSRTQRLSRTVCARRPSYRSQRRPHPPAWPAADPAAACGRLVPARSGRGTARRPCSPRACVARRVHGCCLLHAAPRSAWPGATGGAARRPEGWAERAVCEHSLHWAFHSFWRLSRTGSACS